MQRLISSIPSLPRSNIPLHARRFQKATGALGENLAETALCTRGGGKRITFLMLDPLLMEEILMGIRRRMRRAGGREADALAQGGASGLHRRSSACILHVIGSLLVGLQRANCTACPAPARLALTRDRPLHGKPTLSFSPAAQHPPLIASSPLRHNFSRPHSSQRLSSGCTPRLCNRLPFPLSLLFLTTHVLVFIYTLSTLFPLLPCATIQPPQPH